MNELYEVLKAIRNEAGLSQKDFAQLIGMKPAAYNMIESGKNQPSYSLLNTVVSTFKVDANRLFNKEISADLTHSKQAAKFGNNSEADFLNQVHDYIRKINYSYQKLIDIRVLLFQELKINGEFSTQSEADLLNKLTRPEVKETNNETILKYPYESLDGDAKGLYLKKLEACLNLFNNTFFECFEQLYNGIRIPAQKGLREKFLLERAKLTVNWKYTN